MNPSTTIEPSNKVPTIETLDLAPQNDVDMVERTQEEHVLELEQSIDPPFEIQPGCS